MKKIQYILSNMALGACILLAGCQDLDEPVRTVPNIGNIEATNISATSLTLTGYVSGHYDRCYFLLSTSQNMNDAEEYEASVNYGTASIIVSNLRPNTTYYYVLVVVMGNDEVRGNIFSTTTGDNILRIDNVTFGNGESGEMPTEIGTCIWRRGEADTQKEHVNGKLRKDGDSWKLPYSLELTSNENYRMYAYAPYDEELTNNDYFVYEGCIPIQTYKYNAIDYLYGQSTEFNTGRVHTDITMYHALTKVVFKFKLAEYYQNDKAIITNITLSNTSESENVLPTTGYLNIRTGAFHTDESSYRETLRYPTELSIDKTTVTELTIMSIPTTAFGNITLTVTIDGHSYSKQLTINEETAWKKGKQHSFDATVNESELVLGNVEVEAWHNINSGDITVNN